MKSSIPALLVAAAACVSLTALAAPAADAPKTTEAQAAKAGTTTVQPHSHLQEKTGIVPRKNMAKAKPDAQKGDTPAASDEKVAAESPATSANAKGGKVKPEKDTSKHFHPRDGK